MPMPYSMETGPYLSMFESFFSDDRGRAVWALNQLKQPGYRFTKLFRDVPADIAVGAPYPTTEALADYMDQDWFGLDPDPNSTQLGPARTGARDRLHWDFTGDWDYWRGSAEDVVRGTMIRALGISLGAYSGVSPEEGSQHWPIGLSAVCGLRWWEGWVKWRKINVVDPAGARRNNVDIGGYVAVTFLTPSHEHNVQPTLLRNVTGSNADGYVVDPTESGDQGLWVTGYEFEKRLLPPDRAPQWLREGEINSLRLGPIYTADVPGNRLVTVSPPEDQGGVLETGRPYKPRLPASDLPYVPESSAP